MSPAAARSATPSRLERCRGLLGELGVDALLVSAAADVRYLSGFRGDDATLVIGADFSLICTDSRYWDQVREEAAGFELVEVRGELLAESVGALRSAGAQGRLGIQGAALSYASYRIVRRRHRGGLRDVGAAVTRLRVVKDAGEIAVMRRAGARDRRSAGGGRRRGTRGAARGRRRLAAARGVSPSRRRG